MSVVQSIKQRLPFLTSPCFTSLTGGEENKSTHKMVTTANKNVMKHYICLLPHWNPCVLCLIRVSFLSPSGPISKFLTGYSNQVKILLSMKDILHFVENAGQKRAARMPGFFKHHPPCFQSSFFLKMQSPNPRFHNTNNKTAVMMI